MDPLGCGLTLESTNARAARRQGVWRMLQAISARETPVDGVSDKDHRGRGLPMYTYKYIYIYISEGGTAAGSLENAPGQLGAGGRARVHLRRI